MFRFYSIFQKKETMMYDVKHDPRFIHTRGGAPPWGLSSIGGGCSLSNMEITTESDKKLRMAAKLLQKDAMMQKRLIRMAEMEEEEKLKREREREAEPAVILPVRPTSAQQVSTRYLFDEKVVRPRSSTTRRYPQQHKDIYNHNVIFPIHSQPFTRREMDCYTSYVRPKYARKKILSDHQSQGMTVFPGFAPKKRASVLPLAVITKPPEPDPRTHKKRRNTPSTVSVLSQSSCNLTPVPFLESPKGNSDERINERSVKQRLAALQLHRSYRSSDLQYP